MQMNLVGVFYCKFLSYIFDCPYVLVFVAIPTMSFGIVVVQLSVEYMPRVLTCGHGDIAVRI